MLFISKLISERPLKWYCNRPCAEPNLKWSPLKTSNTSSRYIWNIFKMHKDQHRLFTFNMPFAKQSYKINSLNCLKASSLQGFLSERRERKAWACVYITHELNRYVTALRNNAILRKTIKDVTGIKPEGVLNNNLSLDLDNISGENVFFYINYEANDALDNHNSKILSLFWG